MNRYIVELHDRVWAYLEAHPGFLGLRCCYCSLDRPQYIILVMSDVHTDFVREMHAMGIHCSIYPKHDEIGSLYAVDVWLALYDVALP